MTRKNGPWTITGSELKYHHELIEVHEDQVIRPDGTPGTYATARIKEGISVLALDEEGFVHLSKEFRYALGRESIEVVSGAIEEGEDHADAARRELREELGIEARDLTPLGQVDPLPSMVNSPSNLFLARGLKFREPQQEGGETISRLKVSFDEAVHMVLAGDITHGSSCVTILRADSFLKKQAAS
jgi:8-oxo-dGTP pyrophosphatase MutT (NUDIX family)